MADDRLHDLVIRQHRAVAALARSLADVSEDLAWMTVLRSHAEGPNDDLFDSVVEAQGRRALEFMSQLGDWLNNMDAADSELAQRFDQTFRDAQRRFRHKASYDG